MNGATVMDGTFKSSFDLRRSEVEFTLAIIKPDAVSAGDAGRIVGDIEASGLRILLSTRFTIDGTRVEEFYREHVDKPFYFDLVHFMASGPSVIMVLFGDDAVMRWRKLMGASDPQKAEVGTIRRTYGTVMPRNAVHGSDSVAAASREIRLMFPGNWRI